MENILQRKLSKIQREIVVGILLGDGNLRCNKLKTKFSLRILQSEKHKNYVFHLYEIFKEFTITPPKNAIFFDSRFKEKKYSRWYFNTVSHSCFRFYYHQFYKNNKKIVPKLIHRWLTPRSIAYWYMDDGSLKWKEKSLGVRFCTDNFSILEVNTLLSVLKEKYNLKCSKQKNRKSFRIYISSESYTDLNTLIFPFLIPSMIYKFPLKIEKEKN